MFGLLGDAFGGIGRGLLTVGRGIGSGLDRMAANSLQAAMGGNFDPSQMDPRQRAALRSQFLINLGAGIKAGDVGAGIQGFQQQAVPQLQYNALASKVQAIMRGPGTPAEKYQSMGLLYAGIGRPDIAEKYLTVAKTMMPVPREVAGAPIKGVDANGRPIFTTIFKSGETATTPGITPAPETMTPYQQAEVERQKEQAQLDAQKFMEAQYQANRTARRLEEKQGFSDNELAWMAANGTPEQKAQANAAIARSVAMKQQGVSGAMGNLPPALAFTSGERNEDWLKQLPIPKQNVIRAIVDGRYPVPSGYALKSPEVQQLLEAAGTYEPGFDLTQWATRIKTRGDFATGKAAVNIRSLNTLVDHVGKLMDTTRELNNSGFKFWNQTLNAAKSQFGGNPIFNKLGIDAQAVVSEAVSLFKGTGATDQEIAALRSRVDPNAPMNEQIAGAQEIIKLAFGRMGALESQFQNAFRKPRDFAFLSPKSVAILKNKLGLDPSALDPAVGAGQVGTIGTSGAPVIGTIKGGYRFKGGNPADKNNWEKVI